MFSFFRRDKTELGVLFDIGSSSVGAGLVKFRNGKAPEVIYTTREAITFQESVDPARLFSEMIKTLSAANAKILKEGLAHLKFTVHGGLSAKHVFYAFSSPWSVSQTKIVTIDKQVPTAVTKEMIDAVIAAEEQAFEAEIMDPSRMPDFREKLSAIEKKVIQTRLNGYEVANPYGKSARTIDISFFMSLMPRAVIDKVLDVSLDTYHAKDTRVASFPLVSYSTIRETLHDRGDHILLDVGGELTDVSIIKNGLILETASFPMGRNFLTRRVARALSVSSEEAISLLRTYFSNQANEKLEEDLKPVVENAANEWTGALRTVLANVSGALSLPQDLFIIINNDFVPFFMKAIREEKLRQFGVADVPFRVTLINHDHLRQYVSFGKTATKDPFIALLAIYASQEIFRGR